MKKICLIIVLMSAFHNALPQFRITDGSIVINSIPLNTDKDENIDGTRMLFNDWRIGKVILKNHEQYDYVRLNFDASSDKFYFNQHDTSFELLSEVEEIRVKDITNLSDSNYDMVFKNNIHALDQVSAENFIQVLCMGKIALYKQYKKRIEGENFTNGISKTIKKYVLHINIFAVVNNEVFPVKLNSNSLDELTSDKKDQIKAFVKSKQLNLKKEGDFIQVLSYYNSISSS